jgi:hypothetical protein
LRLQQRTIYNQLMQRLGLSPVEVSDYYANLAGIGPVFFNDPELMTKVQGVQPNPWSVGRFGVVLPALRKMWLLELLYQQVDPRSPPPVSRDNMWGVLEVNLPVFDEATLLSINHQLQALVDIIRIAERDGVLEISQVNLLRPIDVGKVTPREPGKTPPPAASPTPQANQPGVMGVMGDKGGSGMVMNAGPTPIPPDQKVGKGTGIELTFRATNPNMVKFLFDIGTAPRTYAVDDLHVGASPDGILNTSATIELLTKMEGGAAGGAPAAAPAPAAPAPAAAPAI